MDANGLGEIRDTRLEKERQPLVSPAQLEFEVRQTKEQMALVKETRLAIDNILKGADPRMLLVVGPCSIHDKDAAIDYAHRLKTLSETVQDRFLLVMRTYLEKPRTTLGWRGLITDPHLNETFDFNEGLRLARTILRDITNLGVSCATEYVDSLITPDYTSDFISWAAVGARTIESPGHRDLSSGLSMSIGFKHDRSGDVNTAIDAIVVAQHPHTFLGTTRQGGNAILRSKGNSSAHVVLRGGEKEPNYEYTHVQDTYARLRKANLPEIVMIDCSHGNSRKNYRNQPIAFQDAMRQRKDGNKGIIGLMVESNINAGQQKIPIDLTGFNKSTLHYGLSVTDECMGWDDTASLIMDEYKAFRI